MKTINVLIVCYKQEELIKRTLDSILVQKEWGLNKIIVSDDCSPDNTWKVLQEFQSRYPDIIEIYRNSPNLGIYKNSERLLSLRGTADLYYEIAGDDAIAEGYFKAVQDFIDNNDIDFSVPMGIYSDFIYKYSNGKESLFSQKIAGKKGVNHFSLHARLKACTRALLVNNMVYERYLPIEQDKGLNLAEWMYDIQKSYLIEKAYYVKAIGEIYYCGIGVSKTLDYLQYLGDDNIVKWQYFLRTFIKERHDISYANAEISRSRFLNKPSLLAFLKTTYYFFSSGYPGLLPTISECKIFYTPIARIVFRGHL